MNALINLANNKISSKAVKSPSKTHGKSAGVAANSKYSNVTAKKKASKLKRIQIFSANLNAIILKQTVKNINAQLNSKIKIPFGGTAEKSSDTPTDFGNVTKLNDGAGVKDGSLKIIHREGITGQNPRVAVKNAQIRIKAENNPIDNKAATRLIEIDGFKPAYETLDRHTVNIKNNAATESINLKHQNEGYKSNTGSQLLNELPRFNISSILDAKGNVKPFVLKEVRPVIDTKMIQPERTRYTVFEKFGKIRAATDLKEVRPVIDTKMIRPEWTRYAVFEKFGKIGENTFEIRTLNNRINIKHLSDNKKNNQKVIHNETLKSGDRKTLWSGNRARKTSGKITQKSTDRSVPTAKRNEANVKSQNVKSEIDSNQKTISKLSWTQKQNDTGSKSRGSDNLPAGNLNILRITAAKNQIARVLPLEVSRSILSLIKTNHLLNGKVFDIKLYPPELGTINIRFTEIDKAVNIVIRVESEEVYRTVKAGVNEIKNLLTAAGVNVEKVDVQFDNKFRNLGFNKFEEMANGSNSGNSSRSSGGRTHTPEFDGNLRVMAGAAEPQENTNHISTFGVNCLA